MFKRIVLLICAVYLICQAIVYQLSGNVVEAIGPDNIVQSEYCPMWEIWQEQKAAGIPVNKRNGWPDRAGRYFEECDQ